MPSVFILYVLFFFLCNHNSSPALFMPLFRASHIARRTCQEAWRTGTINCISMDIEEIPR